MKWVTRAEMREIDRRAIEEFGVPGVVLMENAGRATAQQALALIRERHLDGPVLVFCGGGNNGGDGWVAARHLSNAGIEIRAFCCGDRGRIDREREAGVNLTVCERMGLPITDLDSPEAVAAASEELSADSLVVDAIFGIGLSRPPDEPQASVLHALAAARAPILAVDVPSGLDADTGQPLGAALRAEVTATMACPKVGFRGPGESYVGRLVVVDIGLPALLVND